MDEPDEPHVDLHDYRGRLFKLAVAAAIAGLITMLALRGMRAVSNEPNKDPIGGSIAALVGICIFVMTWAVAVPAVDRIARRLARRAPPGV